MSEESKKLPPHIPFRIKRTVYATKTPPQPQRKSEQEIPRRTGLATKFAVKTAPNYHNYSSDNDDSDES